MIPFDAINAAALSQLPSLLAELFPQGVRRGHEYVLGDLTGAPGRSLSVNLNTGRWAEFAGDARGSDPISLFAAAKYGGDQGAAAKDLGQKLGIYTNGKSLPHVAPVVPLRKPQNDEWEPAEFSGTDEPAEILSKWHHVYRYRRHDGTLIGYVLRSDKPDGSRNKVVPLNYGRLKGALGWHHKHIAAPRPLYGLDRLATAPDARVLVVEGEKAADAATAMFPDCVAVTWQAGCGNVRNADWASLAGRKCVIWPDADVPGYFAAAEIAQALPDAVALDVVGQPQGFDAADLDADNPVDWLAARIAPSTHIAWAVASMVAGGYGVEIKKEGPLPSREWLEQHARTPTVEEPPPGEYADYAPRADPAPEAQDDGEGIIPLGHDRGNYYYLSRATGQVESIAAAQHSRGMLTHLASEAYYWQRTKFAGAKGIDWNAAADDLRVKCRAVGIFDPDRLRGRGAWLDKGRAVLHLGDRLLVDGAAAQLSVPGSRFVYERGRSLPMDIGAPLTSAEAKRLMDLCVAAPWEAPEHMGRLLAGWCVIAPVCGAMPWRPHLWITSEQGGGKSWILDNILKPTVGPIALEVQSKTTEAGIRQTLGCDARPVLFDEAETQNDQDRARVQLVLDLARQASSEGGAAIIKGSATGRAMLYHIRSCFAFSSINVGLSQAADESRTVVLTLSPDPDDKVRAEAFAKLQALHAEVMTPGYSSRLLSRTLSLLPVIRANAVVFADAIARAGQSRRTGDTYGVLLAGAWSLRSRSVATAEEAKEFIGSTTWVRDAVVKADVDPEWKRALDTLLQHRVRITNLNGRGEDVPVGELLETCAGIADDNSIRPADAATALNRIGLKPGSLNGTDMLFIGNHSAACQEAFAKTPWAVSWLPTLSRAPGAIRNATNVRLAGNQTKALAIPREAVIL